MRRPGGPLLLLGTASLVVLAVLAAGFMVLRSPAEERLYRLDERRIENLIGIARSVDVYAERHDTLPESLEDLRRENLGPVPRDPVTGASYEYRPTGEDTYELCAELARPTPEENRAYLTPEWRHGAGRTCFPREVEGSER